MRILVIAPHPDDELIGPGGTLKKYINEGHETFLCIVTKAYSPDWDENIIKIKRKEVEDVVRFYGFKDVFFCDLPAAKLDSISSKDICLKLKEVVEKVKPDIVFIPHDGDLHNDHRIVHNASLVALRPINHITKRILVYESLSETEWGKSTFAPNVYVDISKTLNDKISAMKLYKTEIKTHPHPRSPEGIEILAKRRGIEVGKNFAEAFMLLREIS